MFEALKMGISKLFGRSVSVHAKRAACLRMLEGTGIEIGALHRPVQAPHLNVHYVDRMTKAELLEQYPELRESPIVEADIIDDAETLRTVGDDTQDFVIANHVIEHMVNPIKALLSWQRVLRPGGKLFLAVPDRHATFDRERALTSVEHLVRDYEEPSEARDFEHFKDFARFVSCRFFKVRPESESEQLAQELWDKQYSIHYHVWDSETFAAFLDYLTGHFEDWRMSIVARQPTIEDEFIFVLEKNR